MCIYIYTDRKGVTQICIYIYMYIRIYICVCMNICMCVCVYIYIYMRVDVHDRAVSELQTVQQAMWQPFDERDSRIRRYFRDTWMFFVGLVRLYRVSRFCLHRFLHRCRVFKCTNGRFKQLRDPFYGVHIYIYTHTHDIYIYMYI